MGIGRRDVVSGIFDGLGRLSEDEKKLLAMFVNNAHSLDIYEIFCFAGVYGIDRDRIMYVLLSLIKKGLVFPAISLSPNPSRVYLDFLGSGYLDLSDEAKKVLEAELMRVVGEYVRRVREDPKALQMLLECGLGSRDIAGVAERELGRLFGDLLDDYVEGLENVYSCDFQRLNLYDLFLRKSDIAMKLLEAYSLKVLRSSGSGGGDIVSQCAVFGKRAEDILGDLEGIIEELLSVGMVAGEYSEKMLKSSKHSIAEFVLCVKNICRRLETVCSDIVGRIRDRLARLSSRFLGGEAEDVLHNAAIEDITSRC